MLIKDPTQTPQLHPKTFKDGFSQSEIGDWDDCAFKWYLRYGNRIQLRSDYNLPLAFGTAFHSRLAEFYRTSKMGTDSMELPTGTCSIEEQAKADRMTIVLDAMTDAYAQYYKDDLNRFKFKEEQIERVVDIEFEYRGSMIRVKGTLDMTCLEGKKEISWDHKSTGLLNAAVVEGWNFKFQFMFYVWLHHQAVQKDSYQFLVNGVKKTQLRQKQGETWQAYQQRIIRDMVYERPAEYFYRAPIDFDDGSIETFEREIFYPKLDRIIAVQDALKVGDEHTLRMLTMNKVTTACHNWNRTCPYFKICEEGWGQVSDLYETKTQKHDNYLSIEIE